MTQILLSAGEASGDYYGAQLIESLHQSASVGVAVRPGQANPQVHPQDDRDLSF